MPKQNTTAQQELEQLRQMADAMPQFVWLNGPDGRHEYVNRRWREYTGQTPEQAAAEDWTSFLHPEDRQSVLRTFQQSLRSQEPYEIKCRYRRHDNVYRWFLNRGTPSYDNRGRVVRWFGTGTDIHDLADAEARLRESEERFRVMADSVPDLIWIADETGAVYWFNRRWYEYTGARAGESDGWAWQKRIAADHGMRVEERFKAGIHAGEPVEETFPLLGGKGQYRWFLARVVPLRKGENRVREWLGTLTDITSRIESEERLRRALKESEENRRLLDALMEHIPMSIIIVDSPADPSSPDLIIRKVSRFARGMIGENDEDLQAYLGSSSSSRLQLYDPDGVRPLGRNEIPIIRAARNGELIQSSELLFLRKDGARIPVLSAAAPVHDASGRIVGAVSAWQDISERKQVELRLAHSQRMESIAFLAAGVAHRFNNLLTPMIGYAELLHRELPPDKAHMAAAIVENGECASELVKQLLAYAGKGQFVIRPVDLSEAVRSLQSLVEASIPKLVRLEWSLQSGLPPLTADPDQIQQIVINLVRNAVESVPEGQASVISIRTSLEEIAPDTTVMDALSQTPLRPGKYTCLEVRDEGLGIDKAAMPKLFDPFFTTKFTGRGLGLPAAAGIVRSHHGAIEVQSIPGHGSTFRVYFPNGRKPGVQQPTSSRP